MLRFVVNPVALGMVCVFDGTFIVAIHAMGGIIATCPVILAGQFTASTVQVATGFLVNEAVFTIVGKALNDRFIAAICAVSCIDARSLVVKGFTFRLLQPEQAE